MRIALIFICGAILAGCVDNYTPVAGGPGSAEALRSDTRDCRKQASDTYLYDQGHGAMLLGVVAGGAVGGALGGAIAGGSLSATNNKTPEPTLDQMVESCMAAKGYNGTSKN